MNDKLEKKYISKDNWKRVLNKEEVYSLFKYEELEGEVSIIKINQVTEPLYKRYNDISVKLADNGYYWLQLAIKNKNYWITAMYDSNKKLIQYYIDITKENIIRQQGKSYFYDLFLDIVKLSNEKIILLDEEELMDALNNNVIDKEEFEFAYKEAREIINQLETNNFKPIGLCEYYLEKLSSNFNKLGDA